MSYLVDSDWMADYLRGRPNAVALLQELFEQGLAISIITYGEIYEGIYYGSDPQRHDDAFRQFLRGVRVIGINRTTARRFARLRGELRTRWQIIPQPDLLIAATALTHDLVLVTRNLSDFQRIPGLRIHTSPD